jgi:predicted GIY-YIG superfamily endonuclease
MCRASYQRGILLFAFEETNRCVYVLQLEDGFIYVGQTETEILERRMNMHGSKKGSTWTSIHKPLNLIEVISAGYCTEREARVIENDFTLQYMQLHGWRNVRGGDYSVTDDLLLYKKLVELQSKNQLSFPIEKPDSVPPEHQPLIYNGINRSPNRPKGFSGYDLKLKSQIKASISGLFGGSTDGFSVEQLREIDCNQLSHAWLNSKGLKYGLSLDDLPDTIAQFEFLKEGKIIRTAQLPAINEGQIDLFEMINREEGVKDEN